MGAAMIYSSNCHHYTNAFLSDHPHEEGWKVYELPDYHTSKRHSFRYLLDFMRDRLPTPMKRWMTVKLLVEEELLEAPAYAHATDSGSEWDLHQELDSYGWQGIIQLQWEQHSIHVLSFLRPAGHGYADSYYVATKSNDALRQLAKELDTYAQRRHRRGDRKIIVVNGENVPIKPVSWDDVFLPLGMAADIWANVTAFFQSKDCYWGLGIPYRRGLLLAGPPGCGKTLTLKAVAYNTSAQVITVNGKSDIDDEHIDNALQVASKHAPSIVFFEDLDKLVQSERLSLSHFLNVLDGFKELNGVMIIATANEPERLDPALLYRPSRFDRIWRFPLPGTEQRLALLRKLGAAYFSDLVLQEIANRVRGLSMAYVQEIVVNALLECAHTGSVPEDKCLRRSLDTLNLQLKLAMKPGESMEKRERAGFCWSSNGDL